MKTKTDRNAISFLAGGAKVGPWPKTALTLCMGVICVVVSATALAVYNQKGTLVGKDASRLNNAKVSFTTTSGQAVPVKVLEEPVITSDPNQKFEVGFALLFAGDSSEAGKLKISGQSGATLFTQEIDVPAVGPNERLVVDLDTGLATTTPLKLAPLDQGPYFLSLSRNESNHDDINIDTGSNTSLVTLTDNLGNPLSSTVLVDPTTNEEFTLPLNFDVNALNLSFRLCTWKNHQFYLEPTFGKVYADLAFMSAAIGPNSIVYSGDGIFWGVGVKDVLTLDENVFLEAGFSHSESDDFSVYRNPPFPGATSADYGLNIEENRAHVAVGRTFENVAPYVGVEYWSTDVQLKGNFNVDGTLVGGPAGSNANFQFDNRFDNDVTLFTVGLKFRLSDTPWLGQVAYSTDSDGNDKAELRIGYDFQSPRRY